MAEEHPLYSVLQGNIEEKIKVINPDIFKESYEKITGELKDNSILDLTDLFIAEKANDVDFFKSSI